ncbi:Light-harvesting complex-like protein ohp1, chloroplastic [Castilleja foliolosa]|uniref:Light-harvesting complex-like protein ohp1, chloroplastic n=1 Tax=Castilleja foliolosa TaxID=1961234 RepID=A0ABD3E0U8_9LAMI
MATSQAFSSPFLSSGSSPKNPTRHNSSPFHNHKRVNFKILATKLPAGVEVPKQEPKFQAPFVGFTRTAETWNSRACMIGLIGTFIVELILNKGILEIIGVEIGKGLDIPL